MIAELFGTLFGDLIAAAAAPALAAASPVPVLLFLDHVQDRFGRYRLTRGYLRLSALLLWRLARVLVIAGAALLGAAIRGIRR